MVLFVPAAVWPPTCLSWPSGRTKVCRPSEWVSSTCTGIYGKQSHFLQHLCLFLQVGFVSYVFYFLQGVSTFTLQVSHSYMMCVCFLHYLWLCYIEYIAMLLSLLAPIFSLLLAVGISIFYRICFYLLHYLFVSYSVQEFDSWWSLEVWKTKIMICNCS